MWNVISIKDNDLFFFCIDEPLQLVHFLKGGILVIEMTFQTGSSRNEIGAEFFAMIASTKLGLSVSVM